MLSPIQQSKPKRWLGHLYIVGLHLLLAVLLFKTDFIPRVKARFFDAPAAAHPHIESMIVHHQAMDASVPAGAAIFLGDSITQGLATAAVAPVSVNYGIGYATTSELLANLPKYQSVKRASVVFLMIGINDIAQGKAEGLTSRLRALAGAIPGELPLVWSSIMPVYWDEIDSKKIISANNLIKELCAARAGCIYVNTQEIFSASGADLFRDGVHPNDRGYQEWISALRQAHKQVTIRKPN